MVVQLRLQSDVGSVRSSRVDVCASFVHYLLGVPKFVKIDYSRTNNWKNKKKLPVHLTSNFLQQVAIVNIFFQLVGHFTFDVSSIFVNAVNTCHVCSYVYESVCGCVFVVWVIIVSDYSEFRINYSILLFSRIVYLVCVHEFLVPCFSSCDRPFRELAPRWAFWNWKFHWGQEQATSPVSNSNSHRSKIIRESELLETLINFIPAKRILRSNSWHFGVSLQKLESIFRILEWSSLQFIFVCLFWFSLLSLKKVEYSNLWAKLVSFLLCDIQQ